MKNIVLICACLFAIISCKKNDPSPKALTPPVVNNPGALDTNLVYIVNEGTFQYGNASVSRYNADSRQVSNDLFFSVNAKPLGDVGESMTIFNNKAYVVVNNSGKIEVVDPLTFKSLAVITGFTSPRFLLVVNSSKAYVSDYLSNSVSIVDLSQNKRVGSIPLKGWTEKMLLLDGKVYVTNRYSDYLYVIDPLSDHVTDSIKAAYGSNSLFYDGTYLWTLCQGDIFTNKKGALCKIRLSDKSVVNSFEVPEADEVSDLCMNKAKDKVFFVGKSGVYVLGTSASSLGSAFIAKGKRVLYGLGYDERKDELYVSDVIDFVQPGYVYRYNANTAAVIDSFKAGVIPGEFVFYRK